MNNGGRVAVMLVIATIAGHRGNAPVTIRLAALGCSRKPCCAGERHSLKRTCSFSAPQCAFRGYSRCDGESNHKTDRAAARSGTTMKTGGNWRAAGMPRSWVRERRFCGRKTHPHAARKFWEFSKTKNDCGVLPGEKDKRPGGSWGGWSTRWVGALRESVGRRDTADGW